MPNKVANVNQSGEDLPLALLESLHALMHQVRSLERAGLDDATHAEGKALGFFGRRPGATASDLVGHSGRDKGQVARLLNGLKDKGLLRAEPDAQDRRVQRIHLTEAGRDMLAAVRARGARVAACATLGVPPDQLADLLGRVRQMRANLEAAAGSVVG